MCLRKIYFVVNLKVIYILKLVVKVNLQICFFGFFP